MTDSGPVRSVRSLLLFALLLATSSSSLYLAILPGIVRGLDLTSTQGGLLVTSSAVAFALSAPAWGRVSERSGRVRIIAIGLLGYAVASAAFAAVMVAGATGMVAGPLLFGLLLVSRPLGGALAGAVPGTVQAYLVDVSDEADRTAAVALIGIAGGLGTIVGPALGGGLAVIDITAPLWFAAVAGVVAAALVARRLPEPRQRDADATPSIPTGVWRDAGPRPYLLVIVTMFVAIAIVSTTLGFLLQDRLLLDEQAASTATGGVLAAVGVGLVAVQILVVQRLKPNATTLLRIGLPVMAIGIAMLLVAAALPVFVLSGLVMGSGAGLAVSGAIAAATLRVSGAAQGTLGGLTVASQTLGFIIGPTIGGALYDRQPQLPAALALGIIALAALWALSARPSRRPDSERRTGAASG
jgi:MFS transporter, DHA1 family, multidrug resistance protein